jgi:FHS family L-fucose permease-like MFS transporter
MKNNRALATLSTVFFFWGFIAAGNSVFIPFCKEYFHLDQFQSQLIDFAFYLAYYIGALGLFAYGVLRGKDLVAGWGYKKSIIYGLIFSAFGALVMIVSVYLNVFVGMLFGLFIVALGFSLQQTSANPFMLALGDKSSGASRISLGGGINSLGTTIGPLIVALALFGTASAISDEMIKSLSLDKIILLYAFVGGLFLLIAVLLQFSKNLPNIKDEEKTEEKTDRAYKALNCLLVISLLLAICFIPVFNSYRSIEAKEIDNLKYDLELAKLLLDDNYLVNVEYKKEEIITTLEEDINKISKPLERNRMFWLSGGILVTILGLLYAFFSGKRKPMGWGAMQYPQLSLGMIAIFVYVGVEVAIGSNLGELLKHKDFGSHKSSEVAPYIAMFWGSLMIGRWAGAINAFDFSRKTKLILRFVLPLVAFGVVLAFTKAAGYQTDSLYYYIICVLIQIAGFYITNDKPALTLSLFGILGSIALILGISTKGDFAIYSILSGGLFCSIMWPCIFSLALGGLGKYQSQGAAFLVMMILGGALIPPLQGKLSDMIGNIQLSFVVGVLCFLYLAFYGWKASKILKKQGIQYETVAGAH